MHANTLFCKFDQSLLSPYLFAICFLRLKKGESIVFVWRFYGRFLSISSITTARTTMIRTNKPAIAGTKYMSATDAGVGVGATVVAADTTAAVSPHEP
jgi:hypothetical protein